MSGRPIDLRNKAVFVGFAEQSYPEQRDDFYTVFSRTDGLDLSGVEIAATSFANLLDNRGVRPLEAPWWALSILCRGLGVGMLLFWLPGSAAVGGAGFLAVTMAGTAYALFSTYGIWLQLLVPLAVQLPAAMAGALLWQRLDSRRESRRLHRTLGLYLPRGATEALARHAGDVASLGGRSLQGVCMATDAARYTRLSESMQPDALRALLNQYFDVLFAPVRRHGGDVSDVVGDAMLAIWSRGPAPALREAACRAALEIIAALDDFNRTNGEARLPTRIGLHCGPIQLGNVGAVDHFEYRAVGDVVNAASRIEGLSKHLGTRILVSAAMVEDLPGFITRELGEFRLAGKTQSLVIYELLATTGQEADRYRGLREAFARGLHAFRARDWLAAIAAFNACLEHTADDGPARYYLELCQRYQRKPRPANWHGVVSMRRK
ncbi:MAG: CHASE2 domain-containing protein [Gammaproteobacteria bacterium]|nr:CHASE2 domain-containing protein [Gammaproteobacteria bacterium]